MLTRITADHTKPRKFGGFFSYQAQRQFDEFGISQDLEQLLLDNCGTPAIEASPDTVPVANPFGQIPQCRTDLLVGREMFGEKLHQVLERENCRQAPSTGNTFPTIGQACNSSVAVDTFTGGTSLALPVIAS